MVNTSSFVSSAGAAGFSSTGVAGVSTGASSTGVVGVSATAAGASAAGGSATGAGFSTAGAGAATSTAAGAGASTTCSVAAGACASTVCCVCGVVSTTISPAASSIAYTKSASPSKAAPPTEAPVMATPFNKLLTFFSPIFQSSLSQIPSSYLYIVYR